MSQFLAQAAEPETEPTRVVVVPVPFPEARETFPKGSDYLAIVAIIVSLVVLWRQFFYHKNCLRIAALPLKIEGGRGLTVVLTNVGTSQVIITRLEILSLNLADIHPVERPYVIKDLDLPLAISSRTHKMLQIGFPSLKGDLSHVSKSRSDSSFENSERKEVFRFQHSLWVEAFDAEGRLNGGTSRIAEEEVHPERTTSGSIAAYHVTSDIMTNPSWGRRLKSRWNKAMITARRKLRKK